MIGTYYIIMVNDRVIEKTKDKSKALESMCNQLELIENERYCKIHHLGENPSVKMITIDLPEVA